MFNIYIQYSMYRFNLPHLATSTPETSQTKENYSKVLPLTVGLSEHHDNKAVFTIIWCQLFYYKSNNKISIMMSK